MVILELWQHLLSFYPPFKLENTHTHTHTHTQRKTVCMKCVQDYVGNCDYNWLHWMGHRDQQPYWFLKLTLLLHVSLVTRRSSPVVAVFKMCVASWSGGSEPPCSETSFISNFLWGAFRMSLIIQGMKIVEKKSKNQQNFTFSRRPTASSRQKARPISIKFVRSFAMHCWCIMDFPDPKPKTSD